MKNPMTLQEQHQALDDNDAGYDMQQRPLKGSGNWHDRAKVNAGKPLNFADCEYRRKPELIERFVNVYESGEQSVWKQYPYAEKQAETDENIVRTVRLVEDTTWKAHDPEEKNPWHNIDHDNWPECKPSESIILQWENGTTTEVLTAGAVRWNRTYAIAWCYAEDE